MNAICDEESAGPSFGFDILILAGLPMVLGIFESIKNNGGNKLKESTDIDTELN